MIPTILKLITIASCSIIVFMGLFLAINKMGSHTNHVVRFAWILITCGAFGVALNSLVCEAAAPGAAQTLSWLGVAVFLVADRREYFVRKHPYIILVKSSDSANQPQ